MGFINALTLVFVAAKLFDAIDWSWWLVFSPTIAYICFVFAIIVLVAFKGSRR